MHRMRHRLAVDVGAVRRRHAVEAETSPGLLYTVRGERDATFAHKALRTRSLNWWDQNRESQQSHASAVSVPSRRENVKNYCSYLPQTFIDCFLLFYSPLAPFAAALSAPPRTSIRTAHYLSYST